MSVSMTVKLKGLREAQAQFSKLGYELKNFPQEMKTIGKEVSRFYKEDVFDTQGAALGAKWSPLSAKYKAQKAKKYPGAPIMIASGRLQKAWSFKAERTRVEIFNPTEYAQYHQTGTSKMPQRLLMKVTDTLQDKINKLFKDMIKAKINRIFGRA